MKRLLLLLALVLLAAPAEAQVAQRFDQVIITSNAGGYLNFGGTNGTSGYGLRDNAGTMEFKNLAGTWTAIGSGGGGGVVGGSCTNQVASAIAATTAVPTCVTITSAYVNSSVATVAAANAFTNANTMVTQLATGIVPLIVRVDNVGFPVDVDGIQVRNNTAATALVTQQEAPKIGLYGTAWNSSASASETAGWTWSSVAQTTAGHVNGTMSFNFMNYLGAISPIFTITSAGLIKSAGGAGFASLDLTGSGSAGAGDGNVVLRNTSTSGFYWSSRVTQTTPGANLFNFTNENGTSGQQADVGSATLGTCTGGTLVTGSHSFSGGVDGNTSGSCTINFSTSWTNAPFCTTTSRSSTTHPYVSAASISAITVSGTVSGENFTYQCMGRIGT